MHKWMLLISLLIFLFPPMILSAEKANDATAYTHSLAQLHVRNADWSEPVIRQAASLSANDAKQLMPINYTGLALVLFGIICIIFEICVSSFGIIGIGGVIAFILGSSILFDIQDTHDHLAWAFIFTMSTISIIFFFITISLALKSHRKAIVSGREGLIGCEGIVLSVLNKQITVRVLGEIWNATSSHPLSTGDNIKITKIQGLILEVEPLTQREHKNKGD